MDVLRVKNEKYNCSFGLVAASCVRVAVLKLCLGAPWTNLNTNQIEV